MSSESPHTEIKPISTTPKPDSHVARLPVRALKQHLAAEGSVPRFRQRLYEAGATHLRSERELAFSERMALGFKLKGFGYQGCMRSSFSQAGDVNSKTVARASGYKPIGILSQAHKSSDALLVDVIN